VFSTFEEIAAEINPFEQPWRVHVLPVALLALVVLGVRSPMAGAKLQVTYDPARYPEKALPLLSLPEQRIFADDEWGDYLVYKLSPRGGKVFVDGRSDFYGSKFNQSYIDVMGVRYDWEKTLQHYGVNTILLHADAALAGAIKESVRWRVVYDDGLAIVFRPAGASIMDAQPILTGRRDLRITELPKQDRQVLNP